MTRIMYDSAAPGLIPAEAPMVAGYVDGEFEWPRDAWLPFMTVPRAHITVEPFDAQGRPTGYPFGNYRAASVIDVESGAFSAASAARFVPARNRDREGTATVYCNKFSWQRTVRRALRGKRFWLWVAWFVQHDPTPEEVAALEAELALPPGVRLAAWQHTSLADYDVSAVLAPDWHAEATP